jgi:bifunctional non-homologous end joining protein LigD
VKGVGPHAAVWFDRYADGNKKAMPEKLSEYRAKRDPNKTPEPMGSKARPASKASKAAKASKAEKASKTQKASRAKKPTGPTFVIQEHHARALHWDFRLEHDGVLVSWALPKGLPETPKTNHLAVHTEDHPLEYGGFQGDIPQGEYGGGHVTIWDSGTYELEKWRDNEVMVVLHGTRASGRYVLFPTSGKNWMIHRMDPAPSDYEPMPEKIQPMLALTGALPASDEGWAYEFKWDGVRAIVYVEGGRVRALTRNDKDLMVTFPELRQLGEFLGSRSAILDGELVALDDEGRPNFGQLAHRLHLTSKSVIARLVKETPVSFLVFDLLYLEGHSLLSQTYDTRRKALESLKLAGDTFAVPPSVRATRGADVLAVAKERGLEGVVVKRRDSPYQPGRRNGDWVKVKNFRTQEVVIGGWTAGKGERSGSLGALLLGLPTEGGLEYVGKVGTGFSDTARRELLGDLTSRAQKETPFTKPLTRAESALAHFVRPEIVGEVQYAEWTADGRLRHPSWRGLRPDKNVDEVVRES